MNELTKLENIGKVTAENLNEVGIFTAEELRKIGSEKAWLLLKAIDNGACINLLRGLEGAVRGIPKKELTEQRKQELLAFYQENQ